MAEWLEERGIGETRRALVEGERILEAYIDRPGELRAGQRATARLLRKDGTRGHAEADGQALLVQPWAEGATEGEDVLLDVVREAIPERGRLRDAKARPALGAAPAPPPAARAADLTAFGWYELLEEARTGLVAFPGGLLAIVPTPAGITIDVDGDLPPAELASRGAAASAYAIRRLGLAGSILIDLPSLEGKAERQAAAAALDAELPPPFERTGVNGFGLLQVVRPRVRPSLMERVQNQPEQTAALDLLRRAAREAPAAAIELRAGGRVAAWLEGNPHFLDALARVTGARIALKAHGADPLWWGDAHKR